MLLAWEDLLRTASFFSASRPEVEAGLYQGSMRDIQLTQEWCPRAFAPTGEERRQVFPCGQASDLRRGVDAERVEIEKSHAHLGSNETEIIQGRLI